MGGLLMQWNANHPGQELRPGDVIIEANGVKGDAQDIYSTLIQCLLSKTVMTIIMLRPADCDIPGATRASKGTEVVNHLPMKVTFQLPDASTREVVFTCRPVGIEFRKACPIVVKRVVAGGQGEKMGVEAGWGISVVDGKDVATGEFESTYQLLCDRVR